VKLISPLLFLLLAASFASCFRKAPEVKQSQNHIVDAESARLADQLAAHPADPSKPPTISGVTDEELGSPNAIEKAADACMEAVEKNPDAARCRFELGRVLVLGGLMKEGREQLEAAAAMGSGGAYFYLGKLEDDAEKAKLFFQEADAAGFKPAREMVTLLTPATPETENQTAPVKGRLPLHDQRATQLQWHVLGPISEVPEFSRDTVSSHVEQIQNSVQRILVCSYGDPKGDFETYYFWYDAPPPNLATLVEGIPTHPLRALGVKGFKTAPAHSDEAARWSREAQQRR
jgi:hypothetical protein